MIEYLFNTIESLFDGLNMALVAAIRLAVVGYAIYLLWKYFCFLKKHPTKTIRMTLAIVLWPFLCFKIPIFLHNALLESKAGIITIVLGICFGSYVSHLLWPPSQNAAAAVEKERPTAANDSSLATDDSSGT